MRRLAALDDHAAADNGALFPVIGIIGLPVGSAMTCCRKDYACLVGNFGCTGCILKPLVTAVAGVICCVAFLRASRSLCGNEGQVVRMRYGLVISAGIADVVLAVIVRRIIFFLVAATALLPVIVCVLIPISCPIVSESSIRSCKGFCCADFAAGAALVIHCVVCAIGSRFECFILYGFLIESMGMRSALISRLHAYCFRRHYESSGFTVRIFKSSAAAFYYPLIKHLTVRSRICSQSNGCAFRRFTDFASCTDCRFAVRYDDGILFTLPDCIEGSIQAYFIGRAGNNRTVGTG